MWITIALSTGGMIPSCVRAEGPVWIGVTVIASPGFSVRIAAPFRRALATILKTTMSVRDTATVHPPIYAHVGPAISGTSARVPASDIGFRVSAFVPPVAGLRRDKQGSALGEEGSRGRGSKDSPLAGSSFHYDK